MLERACSTAISLTVVVSSICVLTAMLLAIDRRYFGARIGFGFVAGLRLRHITASPSKAACQGRGHQRAARRGFAAAALSAFTISNCNALICAALLSTTSARPRAIDLRIPTPHLAGLFSVDGGKTKLADYGRTSDFSDFLNSGAPCTRATSTVRSVLPLSITMTSSANLTNATQRKIHFFDDHDGRETWHLIVPILPLSATTRKVKCQSRVCDRSLR